MQGTDSFVGVGPPTRQAWGQVAARPGHQVTVSTRPRRRAEGIEHGIGLASDKVPGHIFSHSSGIVIVIVVVSWVTGCARSSLKNWLQVCSDPCSQPRSQYVLIKVTFLILDMGNIQ